MALAGLIKRIKRLTPYWVALFILVGCSGADKPFTLVSDTDSPDVGSPGVDGSGNLPPVEGCSVNFNGTMQLKVSADPTGASELEKLDAQPITIDSIPILVNGNTLTLSGDTFPDIILTNLSDSADLRVSGIPGTSASGTYDPATGAIEITGFQFSLEILNKGTLDRFIDGSEKLTGIDFTTGSVTATGNLNPINEEGTPLNTGDRSISLVLGITLPGSFPTLSVLDTMIAGGALTARFDGSLDQLPEDCTEGGGTGGSGSGGPGAPTDFSISDGSSNNTGSIDFGTSLVIAKLLGSNLVLDCSDALNRSPIQKLITIKNTSPGELKIKVLAPSDTDGDGKDPLCSGTTEFIRGSLKAHGAASCSTVSVGGKLFETTECTIPEGDSESYLTFPLLYVPFNFVQPAEGEETKADTGALLFEYDDGKAYTLEMKGRTEKDSTDSFAVSKVTDGSVSNKEFLNNDVIKIPLSNDDPKPFTQTLALLNKGTDDWEEISITFASEESVYSVGPLTESTLPAAGEASPGQIQFDVSFNPGAGQIFNETMKVSMVRVGSKTADNPQGTVAELSIDLNGTVGVPSLSGAVKLRIDIQVAKIDHAITSKPIESLDFRDFPEQAPPPLDLVFTDTEVDGIKEVNLNVENKSVMDKTLAERKTSLRILNAQATYGTPGRKLVPGEGSDLCNEAPNINIPYDDNRMECSYFYFSIFGDQPGYYDDDTGELTLPDISLAIENPYHSDIAGKWLPSNPGGNPTNILNTQLQVSLTTLLLDQLVVGDGEDSVVLVPDDRILKGDLSVKGKPLGEECPGDFPYILNHDPSDGTIQEKHPHLRCYLTADERFMKGRAVSIRPDNINERDVVLVGVGRYPSDSTDPNLPWFMGEGGGSRMYIAIQARLFVE